VLKIVLALAGLACAACDGGVPAADGLEAMLRVAGGQYFLGQPSDGSGPQVTAIDSLNNTVHAGEQGKHLSGRVGQGGQAVVLAMAGDPGYWVIPVGPEDVLMPGELTYDARLSFSLSLQPGPHDVALRAVDESGNLGPANTITLNAQSQAVDGALVITLSWDTESDLDLHVVDAGGVEIWARHLSDFVPPQPGDPIDPAQLAAAGYLDFDSNSQCVIDGRRQEDVLWKQPPPPGVYTARVDTFSLCGTPGARWAITATLAGAQVAAATGVSTDGDTRLPHDEGAGVLAFQFLVPDGM
jgi:hypothetical protein